MQENDSSVRIGDNARIEGSAIGQGASVKLRPGEKKRGVLALIGSALVVIGLGWITNYLYDWTATVWKLFGHAAK